MPTVFLPYPFHKDDHQRLNAEVLEQAGGALVLTDRVEVSANAANIAAIGDLLADATRREGMKSALERLGPADGAARIAAALVQ